MPEPEAGEWREGKNESEKREGGTKETQRDIENRDTEPERGIQ